MQKQPSRLKVDLTPVHLNQALEALALACKRLELCPRDDQELDRLRSTALTAHSMAERLVNQRLTKRAGHSPSQEA